MSLVTNTQEKPVAEIVGGDFPRANGKYCIDDFDRIWFIEQKHSGANLIGYNHEAVIPYWSSYVISLPGLSLVDITEKTKTLPILPDNPTAASEIARLDLSHDDLVQDSRYGLKWVVRKSIDRGFWLDGYDGNHWLSSKTLNILSLGELIYIF